MDGPTPIRNDGSTQTDVKQKYGDIVGLHAAIQAGIDYGAVRSAIAICNRYYLFSLLLVSRKQKEGWAGVGVRPTDCKDSPTTRETLLEIGISRMLRRRG